MFEKLQHYISPPLLRADAESIDCNCHVVWDYPIGNNLQPKGQPGPEGKQHEALEFLSLEPAESAAAVALQPDRVKSVKAGDSFSD